MQMMSSEGIARDPGSLLERWMVYFGCDALFAATWGGQERRMRREENMKRLVGGLVGWMGRYGQQVPRNCL
jgi:hypothetical protein